MNAGVGGRRGGMREYVEGSHIPPQSSLFFMGPEQSERGDGPEEGENIWQESRLKVTTCCCHWREGGGGTPR